MASINHSIQLRCAPVVAVIRNLQWPTVKDMVLSETAKIVFKSLNNIVPDYLSCLLMRNSDGDTISPRNTDVGLFLPSMETRNGQQAFALQGAEILNELSCEASLSSIKKD